MNYHKFGILAACAEQTLCSPMLDARDQHNFMKGFKKAVKDNRPKNFESFDCPEGKGNHIPWYYEGYYCGKHYAKFLAKRKHRNAFVFGFELGLCLAYDRGNH